MNIFDKKSCHLLLYLKKRKFNWRRDVKVTINTYDLLIFDSSIENEYLLLYSAGALNAKQLDEIRKNGLS